MPAGKRFRKTLTEGKVDLSERQVTALWFRRLTPDEAKEIFGQWTLHVMTGLRTQGLFTTNSKAWVRTAFGGKVQRLAEKAGFTLKGSAKLTTKKPK